MCYSYKQIDRDFRGGGIIILYIHATFGNTTSDDERKLNVEKKRFIDDFGLAP